MDDDDWSPDGGNSTVSMEDESEDYQPRKRTRRRTSSRKRKLSSDQLSHAEDIDVIAPKRRRSRRLSKNHTPINLENSNSDNSEDTLSIIINTNQLKPRKKPEPMEEDKDADDDSEEMEIMNTNTNTIATNERGRKRKAEHVDSVEPPSKKRRVSNSTKNTTSCSKKKVLLKGNEATEKVREFMVSQNRPHSKNSTHCELMGAISVGQIQKSLDELKEEGILVMREFGNKSKTKIYWVDQEALEENDDSDENEVMMRIKELQMTIKQKREHLNATKKGIAQLKTEPTDAGLDFEMKKTLVLFRRSEEKLKALRESNDEAQLINQEDLDEKLIEFYKYGKAWKERKAAVMDMVSQIFPDSNDKPDKILTKQLNGETDKDNDVDWEHYKELYKLSARAMQQQKDKAKMRG